MWMSHVKPVGVQLFTENENADILTSGFHHWGQTGGLHPSQQRLSHTWNRCRRYDSVPSVHTTKKRGPPSSHTYSLLHLYLLLLGLNCLPHSIQLVLHHIHKLFVIDVVVVHHPKVFLPFCPSPRSSSSFLSSSSLSTLHLLKTVLQGALKNSEQY